MTTKSSQNTENMLDQTFQSFDTQVTEAETADQAAAGNGGVQEAPKKNNSTFIAVGIAAVGAIAYLFFVKPMLNENQAQTQQAPVVPLAQQPVQPQVDPAAQAQQPAPVQADPLAQAQQPVVAASAPVAVASQEQPVAQVAQAAVAVASQPVDPVMGQMANSTTPTPAQAPVVAQQVEPVKTAPTQPATKSDIVISDLKNQFDKQTDEFKVVLTDLDSRVTNIEAKFGEQKDINEKVDQRLTALESKKRVVTSSVNTNNSDKPVVKKSTPKTVVQKQVKKDDSILIDKSGEETKVKESKEVKVEKEVKVNLPKIDFHSIYGGRVWIKNSDGSLSTYSKGDKLPTGETITGVDDENFEVSTNKRVIKN